MSEVLRVTEHQLAQPDIIILDPISQCITQGETRIAFQESFRGFAINKTHPPTLQDYLTPRTWVEFCARVDDAITPLARARTVTQAIHVTFFLAAVTLMVIQILVYTNDLTWSYQTDCGWINNTVIYDHLYYGCIRKTDETNYIPIFLFILIFCHISYLWSISRFFHSYRHKADVLLRSVCGDFSVRNINLMFEFQDNYRIKDIYSVVQFFAISKLVAKCSILIKHSSQQTIQQKFIALENIRPVLSELEYTEIRERLCREPC